MGDFPWRLIMALAMIGLVVMVVDHAHCALQACDRSGVHDYNLELRHDHDEPGMFIGGINGHPPSVGPNLERFRSVAVCRKCGQVIYPDWSE